MSLINIKFSQKIISPSNSEFYYSRERLLEKIHSFKDKKLILITAPAGYGKTSLSAEYFNSIKRDIKIWISLSHYDNSIENFFLLLSLAFEKNIPDANFGENIKKVIATNQNISSKEKIHNVISSFSNDLFLYLETKKKNIHIFLDDFHNIDDSTEVCEALNYFMDYLSTNVHFIFISRRDPAKINYSKFLAKNWLGRITKTDLAFKEDDFQKFFAYLKKNNKIINIDRTLLENFLKSTEGWITAIQLVFLVNDFEHFKLEDIIKSKQDLFTYFTNEIFNTFSEEEKKFLYLSSYLEALDEVILKRVLGNENGFKFIKTLYDNNVFMSKEDNTYRFHELFKEYLNNNAVLYLETSELESLFKKLGSYYLKLGDWRSEYIGLNYLIDACEYELLKSWIRLNATEKLFLIHSSNLFSKIQDIRDNKFKESLEYILLNVNTYIYIEKNLDKTLEYLKNLIVRKFKIKDPESFLIPKIKIRKNDVTYYTEILMLISNCNFLKYGISPINIDIAKHILKFKLSPEQEIQFLITLVKSYITTANNSKSKPYINRLREIFHNLIQDYEKGLISVEDNNFIESIFSLLIFFDYGDYKTGNKVVNFIKNNIDFEKFDLSNYSQVCFALFTSYNSEDFQIYFNKLKEKNKEKNKTLFLAYKNQYEFQRVLLRFLNYDIKDTIAQLEIIKKNVYLKNYIFFIDALILYCYNLVNQPAKVIYYLNNTNEYNISDTRKLILKLEAFILLDEFENAENILREISKIQRENFTLFNQAVIFLCECYMAAIRNDESQFEKKFKSFINLVKGCNYENYMIFRMKLNKIKFVFVYAVEKNIETAYLTAVSNKANISLESKNSIPLNIKVLFLDEARIYINGKEIENTIWERPKSKLIFSYLLLRLFNNKDLTKDVLINDIFINTASNNLNAFIDVEVNKVRKGLQSFLKQNVPGSSDKDILIVKDKKYQLFGNNYNVKISFDTLEFIKLSESSSITDNEQAFEMYKNEFLPNIYLNWAEDIRENMKFNFQKISTKLLFHYESEVQFDKYNKLLEKLYELDPADEEITSKLLNYYNSIGDMSKVKFVFDKHKKALKNEFNLTRNEKLKKYFTDIKKRYNISA